MRDPAPAPATWRRSVRPVLVAVAGRPWLWPVAVATVLRLARPGWWRHWPPVPRPDPDYWRFRMETAYGADGGGAPDPGDVVGYLRWCRRRR